MTLSEHKAALGDAFETALDAYKAANNLTGSATWSIELTDRPTFATFNVNRLALLKAVQDAKVAISREWTRYWLNGIYLAVSSGKLDVVATNGHILVHTDLEAIGPVALASCILSDVRVKGVGPSGTGVARMAKALKASRATTVELSIADDKCTLDGQTFAVVSGTYPDWRRVLPNYFYGNSETIEVSGAELTAFLDQVLGVMAKESKRGERPPVVIKFDEKGAHWAEHTLAAAKTCRPFAVNSRYLAAMTNGAAGVVKITSGDQFVPLTIDCGDGVTRVAMPMHV